MVADMTLYEDLANEIIKVAANDYRDVMRRLKKRPGDEELIREKDDLEYFFRSDWCASLTDLDGEYILHRLMQETAGKVWFD